jgi:hypothetical protein
MTAQQVTEKLRSLGYTEIRELEADDGHWEADVVKDGRTFEVHVDPHSGALTKNEPSSTDAGRLDYFQSPKDCHLAGGMTVPVL